MAGLPYRWGATEAEHRRAYPADHLVPPPQLPTTRAVTVAAPSALVYRWLCQLSVAPYSYDLIDHGGRRSPRALTPGAEDLRPGQELLGLFELTHLQAGSQFTLRGLPRATRLFGELAMTYAVHPGPDQTTRLVGRLVTSTGNRWARIYAPLLAWGDLVMMRKQLHTLRKLAERDAVRGPRRPRGS